MVVEALAVLLMVWEKVKLEETNNAMPKKTINKYFSLITFLLFN